MTHRLGLPLVGLLVAVCTGCVTESRSRSIPPQPRAVAPTSMLPTVQQPRDTDSNGYPDRIVVSVFLFNAREYPQSSLVSPGSWRFWLETTHKKVLARWDIDQAHAEKTLIKVGPGPCYAFTLSLLDHGTDVMEPVTANLMIEFGPTGGEPVKADPTALRLGRTSQ